MCQAAQPPYAATESHRVGRNRKGKAMSPKAIDIVVSIVIVLIAVVLFVINVPAMLSPT